MADSGNKRKQGPGGGNGSANKKSKGGNAGRWQTPHQKAKQAEKIERGTTLATGDEGIWVTYARGMKGKALREFKDVCWEYGEMLFDIKRSDAEEADTKDEGEDGKQDIEASIKKELECMKEMHKPKDRQVFTPVFTNIECVFFMKTMKPAEPDTLVRKICEDAKACPDPRQRKTKYVNRLTPVFDTEKATEKGIEQVARTVMAPHFDLKSEAEVEEGVPAASTESQPEAENEAPACTFAIRHTIRNHKVLKSDAVIKSIANLVKPKHKVNLTSPDKVVLVEIFQLYCGISVVDGKQWEDLKRYNMNELYKLGPETEKTDTGAEEAPETS